MCGWLELKNTDVIKKATKIEFRPGQYNWIRRFERNGTFCAVLVAHDEGIAVFPGRTIKLEYTVDEFYKATVLPSATAVVDALQGAYDDKILTAERFYTDFDDSLAAGTGP